MGLLGRGIINHGRVPVDRSHLISDLGLVNRERQLRGRGHGGHGRVARVVRQRWQNGGRRFVHFLDLNSRKDRLRQRVLITVIHGARLT